MRKLLKLENDSVAIKITGREFPEAFVYNDEFYKTPEFVGNIDKVSAIISGYISTVLHEMKAQKKQFLRLKFDFCEANYQELQDKENLGVQTELCIF